MNQVHTSLVCVPSVEQTAETPSIVLKYKLAILLNIDGRLLVFHIVYMSTMNLAAIEYIVSHHFTP